MQSAVLRQVVKRVTPATAPCRSSPFSTSSSFSDPSSSTANAPSTTPPSATPDSPIEPAVVVEAVAEVVEEPVLDRERGGGKGYRAWLSGDGARFRNGLPGRTNWLGDTPFPLNPTFAPLPPLADTIKTRIFKSYTSNILVKGSTDSLVIRAVSAKFGIGMERVRAIVRLKELEASWKAEGRTLQTGLLAGMESHLGVKQPGENWKGVEQPDASEALRASSKTIFEMVDVEADDQPVFLPLLSNLPLSTPAAAKRVPNRPVETLVPATRAGRAGTLFQDVSKTWQGRKLAASYDANKTKRGNKRSLVEEKPEK